MNTLTIKKSVTGLALGMVMFGLVFNPLATTPVHAQSIADLQAQIQQLLAQLTALQAQTSGNSQSGAGVTFTRDLTVGNSGVDVTALQQFLISKGHVIPAGATSYFGPQTKAALAAYQSSKGISPAVGYFGPLTRANINSLGNTTTPPSNNGGGSGSTLEGGAGSVREYKLTTGFHNEEVGENVNDVEVAGLDITADNGSDIRLTAVTLAFDEDSANTRFDRYADEVSIWLDGEEIARVDADTFNKRNNWTKNVSLKGDTIIKRGSTGTLVVAISGARNIDSANLGQSWTVDFRSVRYVDAQGASISEDPNTSPESFSFESFATTANVKLKITRGDKAINDERVINVHADNRTRDVDVLSFHIKVEGDSDVALDSVPIEFSVTGAEYLDEMATAAYLYMDGKRVGTENISADENTVVFDKLKLTLRADKTYEFVVKLDLLAISSTLNEGDTIAATIGENETNSSDFEAEDESGEELSNANKTGAATGGAHIVYDKGIKVSFISASETLNNVSGSDNDYGTFTMKYQVEAFDGVVYVAKSAAATATTDVTDATINTNGLLFMMDKSGVGAVTDGLASVVSWKKIKGNPREDTNGVRLNEGDVVEFTLNVVRTNNGDVEDDGFYRVLLSAIGWNTDNSTTYNVYDFNMKEYMTEILYLN